LQEPGGYNSPDTATVHAKNPDDLVCHRSAPPLHRTKHSITDKRTCRQRV
jgi:hypothetical protein